MTLALSYDHGLMDGYDAASALSAAKSRARKPRRLITRGLSHNIALIFSLP